MKIPGNIQRPLFYTIHQAQRILGDLADVPAVDRFFHHPYTRHEPFCRLEINLSTVREQKTVAPYIRIWRVMLVFFIFRAFVVSVLFEISRNNKLFFGVLTYTMKSTKVDLI